MKILMISGFLGAGKTTFIQKMAEMTGRQFVIVENEFGKLGVDGRLLESGARNGNMQVWELSEGCICCSLNLDFTHSVLTIANSLNPDYLIVEPSGVALPGNIIAQLRKVVYGQIGLLAPISLVDAKNYRNSRRDFGEYFSNQLYTAGMVALSKSEGLSAQEYQAILDDLHLPEGIQAPLGHYSGWDPAVWQQLLHRELLIEGRGEDMRLAIVQHTVPQEQYLENISFDSLCMPNAQCLAHALEWLIRGAYGKVVRAKGFFPAGRESLRFDLVEGEYMISGIEEAQQTSVVVIGQHLDREGLAWLFGQAYARKG